MSASTRRAVAGSAVFVVATCCEQPALARTRVAQHADYRSHVPGWWPRPAPRTPSEAGRRR